MGKHIKPEGWHNWGDVEKENTAFFAEHGSFGPGANPEKRVLWSHQISEEQVQKYHPVKILGEWLEDHPFYK